MVTHIVFWNYKEELSANEKIAAYTEMKQALENLTGQIDGLITLQFNENITPGGLDLCLYSTVESRDALASYLVHPLHIAAASIVKKYVKDRHCVDYEN